MDSRALRVMTSSVRHDWPTPWPFFSAVEKFFRAQYGGPFELDCCADASNTKAPRYFSLADNGLARPWWGRVWCNPPYGPEIELWVRKAAEESRHGAIVACLVPARTDTKWFHSWAVQAAEIRFIAGRIKFVGAESCAPFPSALLVFDGSRSDKRTMFWNPYDDNMSFSFENRGRQ